MFSILGLVMMVLMFGLIAAGGVAVFRRLSGSAERVEAGAFHEKLLFEIDRLQVQVQIANERLERLEANYRALPQGDNSREPRSRSGREEAQRPDWPGE